MTTSRSVAQLKAAVQEFREKHATTDSRKRTREFLEGMSFLDYVEEFSKHIFTGDLKGSTPPKTGIIPKRTHTLMLSDLHFGADISGEETGVLDYKRTEEARRFAAVIREAARYKPQYRKHTHLVVALLGDVIENHLHDSRTGAVMAEQCCRAIHLLAQGIGHLAKCYPSVEVVCATGNHDRNGSRHQKRAVHQKFDSYTTIIYYALKHKFAALKNVTVSIPKAPMAHYEVYGQKIAYTHGDTVINPGNPYRSINTKTLEDQVNKFNASLKDDQEFAAILYGHTHIGHVIHLANGTILIGNGALPPADPFSVSLGSYESNNGQWIFESVPGHPVGDLRYLRCGKKYDADKTLDSIIKPWDKF